MAALQPLAELSDRLVSKANKQVLVLVGLGLLLVIVVALAGTFYPKYEEKFIELGLLGRDKTATGYYPNDNPTLNSASQVNWYVFLHNHMSNSQYVTVKVKLLNSTMQAANDTEHEPSPLASITELPLFLSINDTQLMTFSWSILSAAPQDGATVIQSLIVNGNTVNIDPPVVSDSSFCMSFELWVYDQPSQTYRFGWESGNGFFSASVNMWFNVSLATA